MYVFFIYICVCKEVYMVRVFVNTYVTHNIYLIIGIVHVYRR